MTPAALMSLLEATWPAFAQHRCGPFTLREGRGGGQRVSAATAEGGFAAADLEAAELAMQAMGQDPLFLIREGDAALDQALAARGYRVHDPVLGYAASISALRGDVSGMAAFVHWPPLAIAADLWAEGGIGPGRLAVMDRAAGPKAAILGRSDDTPSGAAFVVCAEGAAMLHALQVRPALRRRGAARNMMQAAINWAAEQGVHDFAVVVTEANAPARALYDDMGFAPVTRYHYRVK
ncbi:GNAT family N-acetyltransferase [Gemmobacter denitrificans]|uniref:GNAT family N-acetyltransferase n=1 Tax=Gemmobacter denitrificans TaxID=3123040 RepID=A0ABU8BTM0_9RHOB